LNDKLARTVDGLLDHVDATGKPAYQAISEHLVALALEGDVGAIRLVFEIMAAFDPVADSAWDQDDETD
jgi:hypothetical protein